MRILFVILAQLLSVSLSAQKWERLDHEFNRHYEHQEYKKAGEVAVKQVNYSLEELDSTDTRYMMSYYNLALAYHGMEAWELAKSYLGTAYNLIIPFYSMHGAELAAVCELYGRIETQLGFHESAENFLFYAKDVNVAVYGKESYEYIRTLYYMADLEMAKADWEQMVSILVEALEIHESHFPKNQDFARYANFLGLIYMNSGGNPEAAATFQWALETYDEPGIEKNFTFAHISNNLALAYYYQSDFENAALHFERADSMYQVLLEDYSENYMMLLSNMASLYYSWEKPDLAREAFGQMEDYFDRYDHSTDLNYIQAVENAAAYHAEVGEDKAAEKYYRKAIEIRRNAEPSDQRELAGGLLLLASLYAEGERYELASTTAFEAYQILSAVCAPGDSDLIATLTFLGYNFQMWEQINKALYYYELSREQIELVENPPVAEAAIVYNNMGVLYLEQDRLTEAIPCLEMSHQLEPDDPSVLYNLGYVYYGLNNPESAREMFEKAKKIYGKMYGTRHPDYADALIMGIGARSKFEDFDQSVLEEIREAEMILLENEIDSTDNSYIDCINVYGLYYYEQQDYRKALEYGQRSLAIMEKIHGKNSSIYASTMLGQADIYSRLGERNSLDQIYKASSRIASSLEGEKQERLFYLIESSKYRTYYYLEEYELARKSMEWVIERDKARFLEMQGMMTHQERSQYTGNLSSLMDYNDYLFHFPDDPEVITHAVNNYLFLKSILLDAERRQKEALAGSDDPILLALSKDYTSKKQQLSNLRSQFGVENHTLDSLQDELLQIETVISRKLSEEMILSDRSFQWQEIRDALGEDEAAVALILFYHTTAPPVRTAHPWYFAFVITPEMEDQPLCIRLYDAMEIIPDYEAYRGAVESVDGGQLDAGMYERLWSRIDSAVSGKKTIYFAPDGLFHELNVEALADSEGGYVIDKYQVKNVYTLSDLLEEKRTYGENRMALLAGDPMFRMSLAQVPDPVPDELSRGVSEFQTRMFPGTQLTALPGTRTEVDSIGTILKEKGWKLTSLTGAAATEDEIVTVRNPRILHLATHGFFARDELPVGDTLTERDQHTYDFMDAENQSRSCLFFAGAQNTLFYAYDYTKGRGDGILTSWEISEMALDSTELVVLSACETGRGDVTNSEGVTGLRRAFHLAGAERILLSLWEVDDQATQLLMREFYSNWLSGMDMDQSLSNAKRYLMNETEFCHPRYWAAFILSGI